MRKIIFLNEANPVTSAIRSNAVKTTREIEKHLDKKASRLPADKFNAIVIKAESEAAADPESIAARIGELESIPDRTAEENAELKGLRLAHKKTQNKK